MLEDLFAVGWAEESHQRTSEGNTCMQPYYKKNIIEDPATSSYVEDKRKCIQEHIRHLEAIIN